MMGYRKATDARTRSTHAVLLAALAAMLGGGVGALMVLASSAGAP